MTVSRWWMNEFTIRIAFGQEDAYNGDGNMPYLPKVPNMPSFCARAHRAC